jgi:hypothetical protein
MNFLNYLLIVVIIFLVDLPWLILGSTMSQKMIQDIQGSPLTLRYIPSLIVYLALGYLIQIPKSSLEAFYIGTATYAVYDFTNYATLKKYSLSFAIMDSLWGGTLLTIVYNIGKSIKLLN